MDEDIHQYAGEDIEVSYDVLRCTHARECVERLPEVFDPDVGAVGVDPGPDRKSVV